MVVVEGVAAVEVSSVLEDHPVVEVVEDHQEAQLEEDTREEGPNWLATLPKFTMVIMRKPNCSCHNGTFTGG